MNQEELINYIDKMFDIFKNHLQRAIEKEINDFQIELRKKIIKEFNLK